MFKKYEELFNISEVFQKEICTLEASSTALTERYMLITCLLISLLAFRM